jgi:group II intron reverse transcriptase/maturase
LRHPAIILGSLWKHCRSSEYKFERLYRVLFNQEMYYAAYQRINAKVGNMTPGTDGTTIDSMSLARIDNLIGALKDETYQPQPARRVYIPKKNGKKRPLGIPSVDDKLVQEVIRMLLEAIFEGQFENCSHGFRPSRSCHTALTQVQNRFTGAKWFIEGDIKGFFDNIQHHVLIEVLRKRISDERFLRLIRKFLNAGYIEDWKFHKTFSGTPQGGLISPILANIYLDQLDKYVEQSIASFYTGKRRTSNPAYFKLKTERCTLIRRINNGKHDELKLVRLQRIKEIEAETRLVSSTNEMDIGYKRLKYVRYADDFLIGVIGCRKDCEKIKGDIKAFLSEKLDLTLSDEKTLITHAQRPARFLGYDVHVRKSNHVKRNKLGHIRRAYNSKVVLRMPIEAVRKKLFDYEALKLIRHNGKEKWKPKGRIKLLNNDDLEILNAYNAEVRGFANYYSIANNSAALHSFRYIMEYSMYKTFGRKYRANIGRIIKKYRHNKDFAVKYSNQKGEQKMNTFAKVSFSRKMTKMLSNVDGLPNTIIVSAKTSLIDRLKAKQCEYCGATNNLEMHHVRKLKDLKGRQPWEKLMIARRRKTLAVCHSCHQKIHHGKMD